MQTCKNFSYAVLTRRQSHQSTGVVMHAFPRVALRRGALILALFSAAPCLAQNRAFTAADYDRAVKFLAPNLTGLVIGGSVQANWLPDEKFWYRRTTAQGSQVMLVDPVKKTIEPVVNPPAEWQTAAAPAGGRGGRGGGGGRGGAAGGGSATGGEPLALSPDGKRGAFVRNWNLWVKDIATGEEKQLTKDGVEYFGYAID